MRLLLALLLVVLLSGCLVSRKHSALAIQAQPLTRTALLPVETVALYEKTNISRDKVLKIGNRVLDTLAKAKEGHLIGPSEVAALLGSNGVPGCLRWETAAKNIGLGSNACAEAGQVASRLGVRQVVRCRLGAPISGWQVDGSWAAEWTGYIKVDMELINLDAPEVMQTSSSTSSAEQTMGCMLFWIPVYYGTTFGRAVDQAERAALTQLFDYEHPSAKKN